jgi:hypothetical protein
MTKKVKSKEQIDKIKKILPDILVYHYFDWAFETQHEELPENYISLNYPFEIKNIIWYDDLHEGITQKVGKTIKDLYYPQDNSREIWFMTVKALALRHFEIPGMEYWEEEAEELDLEIEDLEYYQKWQSAKKFSELSNLASFHSSQAVEMLNSILFEQINQELIANKNKGKRQKAKGFKSF